MIPTTDPTEVIESYFHLIKDKFKVSIHSNKEKVAYVLNNHVWEFIDFVTLSTKIMDIFREEDNKQREEYKKTMVPTPVIEEVKIKKRGRPPKNKNKDSVLKAFDKRGEFFTDLPKFERYTKILSSRKYLGVKDFENQFSNSNNTFLLRDGNVFDLKESAVRPPRPEELFNSSSGRLYIESKKKCSDATKYLKEIYGENYTNLMKFAGLCFTSGSFDKLTIFLGSRNSQKEAFADLLKTLINTTYKPLLSSVITKDHKQSTHNRDLINTLDNSTFALCKNYIFGQKLDTNILKTIIGKEHVLARNKYSTAKEYPINAKFCVLSNHRPEFTPDEDFSSRVNYFNFKDSDYKVEFTEDFLDQFWSLCMKHAKDSKIEGDNPDLFHAGSSSQDLWLKSRVVKQEPESSNPNIFRLNKQVAFTDYLEFCSEQKCTDVLADEEFKFFLNTLGKLRVMKNIVEVNPIKETASFALKGYALKSFVNNV